MPFGGYAAAMGSAQPGMAPTPAPAPNAPAAAPMARPMGVPGIGAPSAGIGGQAGPFGGIQTGPHLPPPGFNPSFTPQVMGRFDGNPQGGGFTPPVMGRFDGNPQGSALGAMGQAMGRIAGPNFGNYGNPLGFMGNAFGRVFGGF